ncbi:MAG: sensor histidine kinase [Acidobacteria bacterium]|nr:sensor histidine kinase [Acidobacteriota bacterium]
MSKVNIRRTVENIRANTTVYSPIVEVVVNAIEAIENAGRPDGKILVRIERSGQAEMDSDALPEIRNFEVEDNGIGFTPANRESFDTLYSDFKMAEGGKGFGRFICLKYFDNVHVDSVYAEAKTFKRRTFSMGKDSDIIINEKTTDATQNSSGTVVKLSGLKDGKAIDKKLNTIARNLVEKLLPRFLVKAPVCPQITLAEANGGESICLNDWFSNELSGLIKEVDVDNGNFTLPAKDSEEPFAVRVFKLYFPKNQKSRISLVAHRREVSGSPIHDYVPEFVDDFYDKDGNDGPIQGRNYIVKAYVFADYLDRHVSLERGGFEFKMENDLFLGISQVDIEKQSAMIAKEAMGTDIVGRQQKKKERVHTYVADEAPWHRVLLDKLDLSRMPLNPSKEEIEARLQQEKFVQEAQIKREVSKILASGNLEGLEQSVKEIVERISGTSRNDLIHYIAMRRNILDLFGKSLQWDENQKYSSEGFVHDIIFPRRGDIFKTPFHEHNLWIVDERLNFTSYLSSDIPLDGGKSERPDLIAYNRRVVFRGDNEPSNPVTIFEFKKPQRDDFVNKSSNEDPVEQIVRYVNNIMDGKFKTPEGMKILVAPNTPFYGFVVCDLTAKVERWLEREKDFKPMPDRQGWFDWKQNINLYIEVVSWEKILKDAQMRNKVFFHKLGI